MIEKSVKVLKEVIEKYGINSDKNTPGEIYLDVWRQKPEVYEKVVIKHFGKFWGDELEQMIKSNIADAFRDYHEKLSGGGYLSYRIYKDDHHVVVGMERCPYRIACESGAPCVRKMVFEEILKRMNAKGFEVDVHRQPKYCSLTIYPDEIHAFFENFEKEVRSTEINFEKIVKLYLDSDEGLQ